MQFNTFMQTDTLILLASALSLTTVVYFSSKTSTTVAVDKTVALVSTTSDLRPTDTLVISEKSNDTPVTLKPPKTQADSQSATTAAQMAPTKTTEVTPAPPTNPTHQPPRYKNHPYPQQGYPHQQQPTYTPYRPPYGYTPYPHQQR